MHICHLCTGDVAAEKSEVQHHPYLHSKFETSLGSTISTGRNWLESLGWKKTLKKSDKFLSWWKVRNVLGTVSSLVPGWPDMPDVPKPTLSLVQTWPEAGDGRKGSAFPLFLYPKIVSPSWKLYQGYYWNLGWKLVWPAHPCPVLFLHPLTC